MPEPHPVTPQDVVNHFAPRDANISPDGRWVAFTLRRASKPGTAELPGEIWLADAASGQSRRFTFGGGGALNTSTSTEQSPRWSPDSKRLAFLSDRLSDRQHSGQRQLWLIDVAVDNSGGGEAYTLTDLRGLVDWPAWSPDGREVTFLYQNDTPHSLIPGDDPHVHSHQHFSRLYAVDIVTRALRPLTPDGFQVHEYAWSPDGQHIAVIATQGDATPSGWYRAELYVIDVPERGNQSDAVPDQPNSGQMRQIGHATRQICAVTWSPDSQQIAFLTSIISDQPLWQGDVCIVRADGTTPARQITPRDLPVTITKLDWLTADEMIYSARQLDGTSFGRLAINGGQGEIHPLWSDYAMLSDWTVPHISVSGDGQRFATVLERPDTPPQVFSGPLSTPSAPAQGSAVSTSAASSTPPGWQQLSQFAYAPLALGRVERIAWPAPDGLEIVGHLVYPVGYQPGQRYPTFVQIHGGPAWSWLPHYAVWWEWWGQYLAGHGYLVFLPNIRGSSGRGTAYTEANVPDMGGMDFQDMMSGLDHVLNLGIADPDRLGIGGWSYGGFMTAWAITQTTRFKAAIMGAGIANWESYYAQNSIRDWQRVYFGSTPYEDLAAHRGRSPIAFVHNVRTPTLILHGEDDQDVSPPQSAEMYQALRDLGVPTELVTYPRERHPILERQHQIDLLTRVLGWCNKYLR